MNYDKNFFYKFIDLPPLPEKFVEECRACDPERVINASVDRQIRNGDEVYTNAKLIRSELSDDVYNWINSHGIQGYNDISVQITSGGSTLGPHTDRYRSSQIFYLIDAGGPNPETIWYQERDKPLLREKWVLCDSYDRLEVVHRCHLPLYTWLVFNSSIIHEVVGLTGQRKTLTVSFTDFPENF